MINPFQFGVAVTGGDFCPRPELVERLRACIEARQHVALLGERRTGKTSLIHEAVRLERGTHLIYAQLWAVRSVEDVAARLLRAVASMQKHDDSFLQKLVRAVGQISPRIEFDELTGQPSVTVTPGAKLPPSGLDGVFDFLEELGARHPLVVALDEFQDIRQVEEGEALLGEMRSRMQRQRKVGYILAGSIRHEMEHIFRDPSSPFFKSLRTLEVTGLPQEVFRQFLDNRFVTGGRRVKDETYEWVFGVAQNNPGDVQQFCAAIWDVTSSGDVVDESVIQKALMQILATERKGYEVQVRPLTGTQIRCLKALARVGGKRSQSKDFLEAAGIKLPASAKRALTRLVDLEIVYGPEVGYKYFDPFFREWVLREM